MEEAVLAAEEQRVLLDERIHVMQVHRLPADVCQQLPENRDRHQIEACHLSCRAGRYLRLERRSKGEESTTQTRRVLFCQRLVMNLSVCVMGENCLTRLLGETHFTAGKVTPNEMRHEV